jgi:hypothetical protein
MRVGDLREMLEEYDDEMEVTIFDVNQAFGVSMGIASVDYDSDNNEVYIETIIEK